MHSKRTVAVIFGSRSVEHDVSIVSAQQVMGALHPNRYDVIPIYITREGRWITGPGLRELKTFKAGQVGDLVGMKDVVFSFNPAHPGLIVNPQSGWFSRSRLLPVDVVFPMLHGSHGEDGTMQGLLELAGLPYVGAGVMTSALARDKIMLKKLMQAENIPVVDHVAVPRHYWLSDPDAVLARIDTELGYPVFIKPATLGSSIGVGRAEDANEARNYLNIAANFDRRLLVERALEGAIEINCALLGHQGLRASVLEQPISYQEFLAFEEKYMRSEGGAGMKGAERKIPAPISDELTARIKQMAIDAFSAVDGHGTARVDFLVKEAEAEVYLNEINTLPGSMAFYLWQEDGASPAEVVDELIALALEAHAVKAKTVYNYKTGLIDHAAARGLKGIKK